MEELKENKLGILMDLFSDWIDVLNTIDAKINDIDKRLDDAIAIELEASDFEMPEKYEVKYFGGYVEDKEGWKCK